MFPDNPNLLEKMVWIKVDEIQHEVQTANKHSIEFRPKSKMLVMTGLLIALVWIISIVL